VGVYVIAAYGLLLQVPPNLRIPSEVPVGSFTLCGGTGMAALAVWWGAWIAMIVGLLIRSLWGYWLGVLLFGLHVALIVANNLRWFADSHPPSLTAAFQVAFFQSLGWLLTDLLAISYLLERRGIFRRSARV
jgi:hypothetical protein